MWLSDLVVDAAFATVWFSIIGVCSLFWLRRRVAWRRLLAKHVNNIKRIVTAQS